MPLARLLPPSLALALLACHDATGVDRFNGNYVLAQLDGAHLPGLVSATTTCDFTVTTGYLGVVSGTYALILNEVQDCRRGGGDSSVTSNYSSGTASLSGDTLLLADTTGSGVLYWRATYGPGGLSVPVPADGSHFLAPHTLLFNFRPLIG